MLAGFLPITLAGVILLAPARAWAIIPHKYLGYYPHQGGHLFFAVSLAIFIYYMIRTGLAKNRGWLYIAISAGLLLLWNVHTFLGHIAELSISGDVFINPGNFKESAIRLTRAAVFYLIYRADNLILTPSMLFLYLGVRWHLRALKRK